PSATAADQDPEAVLVRPDGHVVWAAPDGGTQGARGAQGITP
ncbi:hypothetical protein, partial [Streptomyces sp. NPDC005877]